jgi:hypothetical protein
MTPEQFVDDIRGKPWFVEGAATRPEMIDHLDAVERAVVVTYELGNADPVWIGRYDEISTLVARDDMTIKERLLALAEIMTPWHAEYLAKRGH